MEFIFTKKDGVWSKNKQFLDYKNGLPDGRYIVPSFKRLNKRSSQENRYFHGVLVPDFRKALNEAGYDEVMTNEQAKNVIKALFLKENIINNDTGEYLQIIRDTSSLSKKEMANLFDVVIKWTVENLNYIIYYPNENRELFE